MSRILSLRLIHAMHALTSNYITLYPPGQTKEVIRLADAPSTP